MSLLVVVSIGTFNLVIPFGVCFPSDIRHREKISLKASVLMMLSMIVDSFCFPWAASCFALSSRCFPRCAFECRQISFSNFCASRILLFRYPMLLDRESEICSSLRRLLRS